jgi:endonuclease YncB( thermonuclease family)
MALPYQFLLPLLSLFWVRVDLTDLVPLNLPVHIIDIRDGDTITAIHGHRVLKVRLSKIDAPEIGQKFHQSERNAGIVSRDCLRRITPKNAVLTIEGLDIYHRILGDVEGLNLRAVQMGCTGLYPHAHFASVTEKMNYLRALSQAKKERRGVWAHRGYLLPKKWRKICKRSGRRRSHSRDHSRVTYRPGRKL